MTVNRKRYYHNSFMCTINSFDQTKDLEMLIKIWTNNYIIQFKMSIPQEFIKSITIKLISSVTFT